MAITTIPMQYYPGYVPLHNTLPRFTGGSIIIASEGDCGSLIIEAPDDFTIDAIGYYICGVVFAGDLRVSVETVDATVVPPEPTTTLFATGAENTTSQSTVGFKVQVLTTAVSIQRGDLIAITVRKPVGSSFMGTIIEMGDRMLYKSKASVVSSSNGGVSFTARPPTLWFSIGIRTDGGDWIMTDPSGGLQPTGTVTLHTLTTSDEVGLKFTPDVGIRFCGASFIADLDNPAEMKLYDTDGTTVLSQKTIAGPNFTLNFENEPEFIDPSVELSAGSSYRIVLRPTSGTIRLYTREGIDNNTLAGTPAGKNMHFTEGPSPWTDSTSIWLPVSLIFDGIETGSSGGNIGFPRWRIRK